MKRHETRTLLALTALPLALLSACDRSKGPEPGSSPPQQAEPQPTPAAAQAAPAAADTAAQPPSTPEKQVVRIAGFSTPESVMYDGEADQYVVSNINGKPGEADDNGFISRASPEGAVTELRWIDGEKKDVTLNAPKGLTMAAGKLYVADIDTVRAFDAKTGVPAGAVKIAGATFLNAMATGSDGTVYVSDTGVKIGDKGVEPTGTDAIYKVDLKAKKATPLIKSKELNGPNGLAAAAPGLWVVTFRGDELALITPQGKREQVQKLPKGQLDGLAMAAGGDLLVSSWESATVYRGPVTGPFKPVVTGVTSPADIDVDTKRNRVLVPLFQKNTVEAHGL